MDFAWLSHQNTGCFHVFPVNLRINQHLMILGTRDHGYVLRTFPGTGARGDSKKQKFGVPNEATKCEKTQLRNQTGLGSKTCDQFEKSVKKDEKRKLPSLYCCWRIEASQSLVIQFLKSCCFFFLETEHFVDSFVLFCWFHLGFCGFEVELGFLLQLTCCQLLFSTANLGMSVGGNRHGECMRDGWANAGWPFRPGWPETRCRKILSTKDLHFDARNDLSSSTFTYLHFQENRSKLWWSFPDFPAFLDCQHTPLITTPHREFSCEQHDQQQEWPQWVVDGLLYYILFSHLQVLYLGKFTSQSFSHLQFLLQ